MKKVAELHLGKYEINSNDKIIRIHFTDKMKDDDKLRVSFLEREIYDNNGNVIEAGKGRDGSQTILFHQLQNKELAYLYVNLMKRIVENSAFRPTILQNYDNVIAKFAYCSITTNNGKRKYSKDDLLNAIELSYAELVKMIEAEENYSKGR